MNNYHETIHRICHINFIYMNFDKDGTNNEWQVDQKKNRRNN